MSYYDGSFFPLDKDHRMLLDERERSFGRSSFWLNKSTKRAYKSKGNKFLFLRRKEREIDEILRVGFGKNLLLTDYYNKFYREKGLHFDVKRGIIYLTNTAINPKNKIFEHVGYIKDLNSTKGLDLMDCDIILFDEYIAEKRSDYKGGDAGIHEPEIFLHLVHTVFRKLPNRWSILLGNPPIGCVTDPYKEWFKIPYGAKKWADKARGIYYRAERGAGDRGSVADILSSANETFYKTAVLNERKTAVPDYCIEEKPARARYLCAIVFQTAFLTIWHDIVNGLMYVSDRLKIDRQRPIYTAFNEDMTIDASFMVCSKNMQLKAIKNTYYQNMIRYSDQNVAEKFQMVLSLLRG